jgi:hypothetical protein
MMDLIWTLLDLIGWLSKDRAKKAKPYDPSSVMSDRWRPWIYGVIGLGIVMLLFAYTAIWLAR